jgi:hypothetical protein
VSARVAGHGYITATLEEPRELVRQYRRNALAVHKLARRAVGRNYGATERARLAREADQWELERVAWGLPEGRQRELVAALAAERTVWARLQDAVMRGQERPELMERLDGTRRAIRRMVAELEEAGR